MVGAAQGLVEFGVRVPVDDQNVRTCGHNAFGYGTPFVENPDCCGPQKQVNS